MENKLPESQLIEILGRKASERSDVVFDYIAKLEELRLRIGGEVRFINELFPEYTPHDEEYHLTRLFHVADTLIGPDRYESMNATELFVLAVGLYGHDWGMAVSAVERDYIMKGMLPDGFSPTDFALLHDEPRGFQNFVKERGLDIDSIMANGIENEDWREYVRKTHALRSGERIRHYFQKVDSGIAEAAGRVCEGHWLDIEDIQDFRRYPTNFAVLRENLNLAALAVYVRLVDLFDIGHDRTPYVIWKFVAPRNRYSKMEWQKHRALQPVTCPQYLNGRVVLVDGSTDDHEVYASLEDLHLYCERQLRECTDLLAQLGDTRHLLDLYHVEWRVVARGFDPVLVRFEFDRDRVFEILSSEIYQGDPYVFLRELLQNSIDAIRMRRELLENRGLRVDDFGLIDVKVDHGNDGDVRISWIDNGVGMDIYVVRNYLAVAGRSYYRSEEFERQGLKLDPISRFGVGLLSCFMVANTIEIETCKEPYAAASSGALRIKIPSITSQFRIELSATPDFGIGTRVTVHVEGHRLPEDVKSLDVTGYLKQIAGFVEFPIVITERSESTVLLHPKAPIDPDKDRRLVSYRNLQTHRIRFDYPFGKAIVPQDVETARNELIERTIDLTDDLGLSTCEGSITHLEIRNKDRALGHDFTYGGITLIDGDEETGLIRSRREWKNYHSQTTGGISRSANSAPSFSVYRDGVLIPNAAFLRPSADRPSSSFPLPQIIVNLIKKGSTQLDLARVELRGNNEHWFEEIDKAMWNKLIPEIAAQIKELSEQDALTRLGLFLETYNPDREMFLASAREEVPSGVLSHKGTFEVIRYQWESKTVPLCPEVLYDEIGRLIQATVSHMPYKGFLNRWRGQESLIDYVSYLPDIRVSHSVNLTQRILRRFHTLSGALLLRSPGDGFPPLVQEIWAPKDVIVRDLEAIANAAIVDPQGISGSEREILVREVALGMGYSFVVIPVKNDPPFLIGMRLFNLGHPVSELLIRSLAWMVLSKAIRRESANYGRMTDAIWDFSPGFARMPNLHGVNQAIKNLVAIASEVGLPVKSSVRRAIKAREVWHESKEKLARLTQKYPTTFGEPLDPASLG